MAKRLKITELTKAAYQMAHKDATDREAQTIALFRALAEKVNEDKQNPLANAIEAICDLLEGSE